MIKRTNSFNILKAQVQSTFDFAVVVCHSVPALKLQMKLFDDGKITKLPDADYFQGKNTTAELRVKADNYKDKLATYLFLSSFAFFENYLSSVIKEVFNSNITIPSKEDLKKRIDDNKDLRAKKILKSSFDHRHEQRYKKYSQELRDNNYITPENLISIITIENFLKTVTDLKANQIPDFLTNHLKLEISQIDKETFGTFRQLRNDIAHGDNPTITMQKVRQSNTFLKKFAGEIDEFLVEHYVKIENYRKK